MLGLAYMIANKKCKHHAGVRLRVSVMSVGGVGEGRHCLFSLEAEPV